MNTDHFCPQHMQLTIKSCTDRNKYIISHRVIVNVGDAGQERDTKAVTGHAWPMEYTTAYGQYMGMCICMCSLQLLCSSG